MEKAIHLESKNLTYLRTGTAILCALILSLVASRLFYPFDVGQLEAFNWMPATHLLEGKNPYAFAFTPPYSMSPYGIVYYALLAVGIEIFGYQIWFGRILSIAAFIVCLWAVSRIVKKTTGDREAVWFACLVGLAMFPMQFGIAMMRADLVAAAFAFSALAAVFAFEENAKIPLQKILVPLLLASAAFFTKQTYLLAAGIIFWRFVQLKKWRTAAIYAAGLGLTIGGGILLINQTSAGGYVWQHFTHARRLPYSFAQSVGILVEMLGHPAFLLAFLGLIIFGFQNREIFKRADRYKIIKIVRSPEFLILIYFALSIIWSFVSTGRTGAGAQYYLESSLLLAIAAGLFFRDFRRGFSPRLISAIVLLFVLGGAWQLFRIARGEYYRWQSLSYYREVFETVGKVVPPGSQCVGSYAELIVWNNCAMNFDDYEEYTGGWSPELSEIFEREVRAGRYAAILWRTDNFTERYPNYHLIKMSQSPPEKFYPVYLYVPNSPPPPTTDYR